MAHDYVAGLLLHVSKCEMEHQYLLVWECGYTRVMQATHGRCKLRTGDASYTRVMQATHE